MVKREKVLSQHTVEQQGGNIVLKNLNDALYRLTEMVMRGLRSDISAIAGVIMVVSGVLVLLINLRDGLFCIVVGAFLIFAFIRLHTVTILKGDDYP